MNTVALYITFLAVVLIALAFYLHKKTDLLRDLWNNSRPDSNIINEKNILLEKNLFDCIKEQNESNKMLCLMRMGERILKAGTWYWELNKDPDEVYYSDNFAVIFDVVPGQKLTAKNLMDIVHVDDRQRVNNTLNNAVITGMNYDLKYRVVRRNDRNDLLQCWGEVIKNPDSDKVNRVNGVVIVLETDVP